MNADVAGGDGTGGDRGLGGVDGGVAGEDPGFVVLGCLEVLVGSGVFDLAFVAIVEDEAQIADGGACCGIDGYVEVDTESVCPCGVDLATAPGVVGCGGVPGVEGPAAVGSVRTVVVNAHVTGGNGGIRLR